MTRISFTTRFFIKHRNNNDHLYVRIIVNRKSSEISLKRTVNLFAEVSKQWHPTKNGDLNPFDFSKGGDKKVWWKCDKGPDK